MKTVMKHPYWMAPTTATDDEAWDNYFAFHRALVQAFLIETIERYNNSGHITKEDFDVCRGPNGPQIPGKSLREIQLTRCREGNLDLPRMV
jgi:hypothetical protein